MTPQQLIADLDVTLADTGEMITIERLVGTQEIPIGIDCLAFVRGYDPDELVGAIQQNDKRVILSPSEITAAGWPGPNSSATPTDRDRRIPIKGDRATIKGKKYSVEAAGGTYVRDELVRIEMRVRG